MARSTDSATVVRRAVFATLLACAFFGSSLPAAAQSIGLAWDAPQGTISGYRVYVGTAPGVYSQSFEVPASTTRYEYLNPLPSTRYYFAVTSYNDSGEESPRSNEVSAVYGGDSVAPSLSIVSPAAALTVLTSPVVIAGIASDNVGVTRVAWSNSQGGSGTAIGTTAWTASVPLQPGPNVITITAHDGANTRSASVTVTYAAPDISRPTVSIATPSSNTTVTSGSLAIAGTASDNVGVSQVTWSTSGGRSGTASGTSSWSATVPLVAGANVLTVTARDAAGNTTSATRTITYAVPDSGAPTVSIATPANGITVALSTIALSGTASDNAGVTRVSWVNDRGGSGTASGTANWSAGVPLQGGANVVTVTARDAANNTSVATVTVTRIVPQQPNVPTPVSPSGTTANATPSFVWTAATQVSSYHLWVNDSSRNGRIDAVYPASQVCSSATGMCTVSPGVALSGSGRWWIRNASGGDWANSLAFSVPAGPDTTLPTVAITTPVAGASFTTATAAVLGSASDNIGVTQVTWANDRGGSGTASGTTSWSIAGVPLQLGVNVITITARDAANNTRQSSISVSYSPPDATLPSIAIVSPAGPQTVTSSSVAMSGTASDNIAVTQVSWVNNRGSSGTAAGTTSWVIAGVPLYGGLNVITVTARDAAGNTQQASVTVTYNAPGDATPPAVIITSPGAGATVTSGTVNVSGAANDTGGIAQVTWSNDRGGSGTASGTSFWTIANVALQAGTNVITVSARDSAGNVGNASVIVTYNRPATSPIPMPLTPSGTATTATPSFTWTPATGASTYQLWVNDGAGNGRIQSIYSSAQAGCSNGAGTCSVSPGVTLVGRVQWWVRNAAGGDWGPSLTFTVPSGGDTSAPTVAITSPFGNVGVSVGTIAVAGTASDNIGVAQVTWSNDRGSSGVATGTTSWSAASVPLQVGTNVITVTARDAAGNARQAAVTVAYVPPTVATIPVPIAPAGTSTTATPTFTWSAVPGATAYHLWANDAVGNGRIQYSLTAAQAGCGAGVGTCSASPGVTLTGRVQWWVRVAAPIGGDWSIGLTFQTP